MAELPPPNGSPADGASAVALPPREKALRAHAVLCAEYGCPIGYFHDLDPLSELVSSLLSHRTKNRDSGRAFRQLRAAFPSWPAVRDAPVDQVQAARTLLQPVQRHLGGIFGKHGGEVHIALFQANAVTVFQVDGGDQQHDRYRLVKGWMRD